MPDFNASQFENIVSRFYEAAVQTRLWPDALAELSAGVGAVGASLVERRVRSLGPGWSVRRASEIHGHICPGELVR